MSEEPNQSPPQTEDVASRVDPSILEAARAAILGRGGQTSSMTVMQYPPALLRELMEKLADYQQKPQQTLEWLTLECQDRDLAVPSQTAFYDFRKLVRAEYSKALLLDSRMQAEQITRQISDNPGEDEMRLNRLLTVQITDELMRARMSGDGGIETKRFLAIIDGTRKGAMTALAKQRIDMDAGLRAKQIENLSATIALKEQQLAAKEAELAAEKAKAQQAVKAVEGAAKGGASGEAVVKAFKMAMGIAVETQNAKHETQNAGGGA